MTDLVYETYLAAVGYFGDRAKQIHHFTKVLQFAEIIGKGENLSARDFETLQIAAILHDIGIPESERKYGSSSGKYQEIEGVPVARDILVKLGADEERIESVCLMISLHHSYSEIKENLLLRILVEADMIVNFYDGCAPRDRIEAFAATHLKTATGKKLYKDLFAV